MWNCESVQVIMDHPPTSPAVVSKVTIVLIDRRALDRECLARGLLASQPNLEIRSFGSVEEWGVEGINRDETSAVLLSIGGHSPADVAVANAITSLGRNSPGIPVIILADSEAASHVLMALDHGVRGYIPSSIGLRVVVEVVNLVRAGGIYVPASSLTGSRQEIMAPELEEDADPLAALLTPRQASVAEALRQGKANKIIAYELDLSESTVKVHIRAIMRRLQAHNRTEVAFKLNGLMRGGRATARVLSLSALRDRSASGRISQVSEPTLTSPQSAASR
ncbi:response regulator transcription factor [Kaistia terrae]|uniref:LuxR C-terminal-related transcriptional regulator n=1 Tax=Kaistia terrae TaxID=537017 RepID=A0ABW0Q0S7_9HYPH|nr:response regulator transcription factor [Kaistia terrae]MCX5578613.1 response regulator transcription factor [Kaistia terrae]